MLVNIQRIILSVLLLFLCMSVDAQKLTIESFVENSRDLSARSNQRLDNNDVPCALVKVHLASAGAVFEGAVMGIVEYKTSEYWVYMPKGSKRVIVKLEGYLPLPVEFKTSLESNVTYVLTITGVIPHGQQQQEMRTKTGWIIIDSDPQGASVYINDEYVGNTPLDTYKRPYGTYRYRLELPNYHTESGVVDLNSAQYEKSIKLSPVIGSISVRCNVSGATVLLDGKNTGEKTPCTLFNVSLGNHIVSLLKDNYAPMQYSVVVEDGKEASVQGTLNARYAEVTIKTMPEAEIFIDNKKKGKGCCSETLMEGYYDIEVRLAHHKSTIRQIQVISGQSQVIELDPKPIYGSLDVVSTPRKADIHVDGKLYGKTPFTIEELLEGSHTVSLSMEGYATETRSVTIKENETVTLSVNFSDVPNSRKQQIPNNQQSPDKQKSFENQTFVINGVSFNMIAVEGGSFLMGATSEQQDAERDESPVHSVTIGRYLIGETEVTQGLWDAIMGPNYLQKPWDANLGIGSDFPAYRVSWDDCQIFIEKLNELTGESFRLPTEAEWEFAARGGNKTGHFQYCGSSELTTIAWYYGNSGGKNHAVKTKQPNELGIYDINGNVWEWCQDWYGFYNSESQTNPVGASSGSYRVRRGGSSYEPAGSCRVSARNWSKPEAASGYIGFRLAL